VLGAYRSGVVRMPGTGVVCETATGWRGHACLPVLWSARRSKTDWTAFWLPLLYAKTPAKTTNGVSNKAIIGVNPNTISFLSFRFLNIWGNKEVGRKPDEDKAELPLCSVTLDPIEE
jgi:hypothetical protein